MGVDSTIPSGFIFEIFKSENFSKHEAHRIKQFPMIPPPPRVEAECLGQLIKHFHHLSTQLPLISASS